MPIIKKPNGKWGIENVNAEYETKEAAEKALAAINIHKQQDTGIMTSFSDRMPLGRKRVVDSNGFAHVPAVITKVGVQKYRKDQLGIDGEDGGELVNVFRPPETVFHPETIESFQNMPVTDNHPQEGVSPTNAKAVQGGHIGGDVQKSNEKELGATLHLTDKWFINKSKGSETSAGYDAKIIRDSGTFEGLNYDYRFDGPMIGNHLALVPKGRCGSACRVLDNKQENEMDEKKVQGMIGDALQKSEDSIMKSVSKVIVDELTKQQADAESKAKTDAEAATKKEDDEKAKIHDRAAIEKSVKLREKIKPLLGDKFDDKLDDKALLVLAMTDSVEDAEGKSVDYLDAMVDTEIAVRGKRKLKPHHDVAPAGSVEISGIAGL